jgi:anti-sigma factor RsiW
MNIDRHNYEECFLLYVDNELTADQKKQVERFVRENPDLEEELVMLQQSRLIPDNTVVFERKNMLMRESGSFINLSNYEEWLVLYVDEELNAEEKIAVEKFAASHPHVQAELELFRQTKLQPEKLKFAHKKSLYRREEKVRVISMVWWRAAAAAILIVAGGVTMYLALNNSGGPADQVAKEQPVKARSTDQQQPPRLLDSDVRKQQLPSLIDNDVKKEVAGIRSKQKVSKKETIKLEPVNTLPGENSIAKRKAEIINDLDIQKPKDSQKNITRIPKHKQIFNPDSVTPPLHQTPNDYASNTENENKRLRGLFRKATRFIERTSGINPANDDDRVLISAMAVNLK